MEFPHFCWDHFSDVENMNRGDGWVDTLLTRHLTRRGHVHGAG